MSSLAAKYGRVLYELGIPDEELDSMRRALSEEELCRVLDNPTIALSKKHAIIVRLCAALGVSALLQKFMLKLCDVGMSGSFEAVCQAREQCRMEAESCLQAELLYVTEPSAQQLEQFKAFLRQRFGKKTVALSLEQEPGLGGGFVLRAKDTEFDYSLRGKLQRLRRAVTGQE